LNLYITFSGVVCLFGVLNVHGPTGNEELGREFVYQLSSYELSEKEPETWS